MSKLADLVAAALARAQEATTHEREHFVEEVKEVVGEEVFEALAPTLDPVSRILHFEYAGHRYVIYKAHFALRVAHPDFSEWEGVYSGDSLLVYLGTRKQHHNQ